jgi:uncharacterized membrane protein YbjE (DUF340 family)
MIQNAAIEQMRGVATSTNSLMTALGQTVGVAVFGMLFNRTITDKSPEQLTQGMHVVFVVILLIGLVNVVAVNLLPSDRKKMSKTGGTSKARVTESNM